jgi:hypothetical protein
MRNDLIAYNLIFVSRYRIEPLDEKTDEKEPTKPKIALGGLSHRSFYETLKTQHIQVLVQIDLHCVAMVPQLESAAMQTKNPLFLNSFSLEGYAGIHSIN